MKSGPVLAGGKWSFTRSSQHPDYVVFILVMRCVLLALSALGATAWLMRLSVLPRALWLREQKMMPFMLLSAVCSANPFWIAQMLKPSCELGIAAAVSEALGTSMMVGFWLCLIAGVRYPFGAHYDRLRFYAPRVLLAGVLMAALVAYPMHIYVRRLDTDLYPSDSSTTSVALRYWGKYVRRVHGTGPRAGCVACARRG